MLKKQSDLLVITKTRDLANYVFTITHKGPKDVDDLPANIKIFPKKKNGLG